jgi:methylenetetrahydrofolate reductase (NADPH)
MSRFSTNSQASAANGAAVAGTSRLRRVLEGGGFALTAEITPPASSDLSELMTKVEPLKDLADAINVTDGAGARAHLDSTIAASALLQNGIEPILQLTCRDRNRIALQSQLLGAAALGISNILALRGDDPKAGDQPEAKPVFDLDSAGLLATAVAIRDRHQLPHGRTVGGRADFFVGAADAPIDPPEGWVPAGLINKIRSGAQFVQTQFCMDAGVLRRYMSRLAEQGLAGRVHMLIGVAPLASAKSARWIKQNLFGSIIPDWMIERLENSVDPAAEGCAMCVELLREYSEIPGVGGAHIMAPLNQGAIARVMTALRA